MTNNKPYYLILLFGIILFYLYIVFNSQLSGWGKHVGLDEINLLSKNSLSKIYPKLLIIVFLIISVLIVNVKIKLSLIDRLKRTIFFTLSIILFQISFILGRLIYINFEINNVVKFDEIVIPVYSYYSDIELSKYIVLGSVFGILLSYYFLKRR